MVLSSVAPAAELLHLPLFVTGSINCRAGKADQCAYALRDVPVVTSEGQQIHQRAPTATAWCLEWESLAKQVSGFITGSADALTRLTNVVADRFLVWMRDGKQKAFGPFPAES